MKKAFTLAEVLITLVVIGIIAAITVPMIHANYKKQETVTRLKKVYSTLSQTTNRAIADNGPIDTWEVGVGFDNSMAFAKKYLIPYLNIIKDCGNKHTEECKFEVNTLNGEKADNFNSKSPKFILNDGTMLLVLSGVSEYHHYAYVYVDINGTKKPNLYGKDVFRFIYFTNYPNRPQYIGKFIPWQNNTNRNELLTSCSKTGSGTGCTALIMMDGWQIKNDYPW